MKLFEKYFRQLAGINFKIEKVYPAYRKGFIESLNTTESFILQGDKRKKKVRENGQMILKDGKPDFKIHKKVYDIEITSEKPIEVEYKGEKQSVTNFTITLSASKIGNICKSTIAFGKQIQQENGRDKLDWEDEYVNDLPGTIVVFSVTGEGLGTEYIYREGKPFLNTQAPLVVEKAPVTEDDDLPF